MVLPPQTFALGRRSGMRFGLVDESSEAWCFLSASMIAARVSSHRSEHKT